MKKFLVCRLAVTVVVVGVSVGMFGCAATQLALEKKGLFRLSIG